jgi:hypothetical protein
MSKDPLAKVYESQGIFAAEVVKAKLEANGIPAILKYESVGQIFGLTVDGLGRVEVHVPAAYAEEALSLVDESEDEDAVDQADTADEAASGEQV